MPVDLLHVQAAAFVGLRPLHAVPAFLAHEVCDAVRALRHNVAPDPVVAAAKLFADVLPSNGAGSVGNGRGVHPAALGRGGRNGRLPGKLHAVDGPVFAGVYYQLAIFAVILIRL